jgi:2-amino-4-hydroxy-6-hydroxymethyldihydropteridine diphosphokinase
VIARRRQRWAFLGLGSNIGDRLDSLQRAVDRLHATAGISVVDVSSVYETEPVGGPEQEAFLNMAVGVATRRGPWRLLRGCRAVERELGRARDGVRWGPRTIDVDILLYEQRIVALPGLEIPHPRLAERPFALVPLIELAPGVTLPDGRTLTQALTELAPVQGVTMAGQQVVQPRPEA